MTTSAVSQNVQQIDHHLTYHDPAPVPAKKRRVLRLSRPLKKNYDYWLDWRYYGEKITYENSEGQTVSKIVAVNEIATLNFWSEKNNLTGKQKRQTVCDLFTLYRKGEIAFDETLGFPNPLSQTKITLHGTGEGTHYYCSKNDAQVSNPMFDWDDKDLLYGDTEAAARWVDRQFFFSQSFVQPSTSGTGTHQYIFVDTDGVSVRAQKLLYKELVPLLREEIRIAGFRCWQGLDRVKGVACEISWLKSDQQRHRDKPFYPRIDVGGIFAKLPRLTPDNEPQWLNRKVVKWEHLQDLTARLRLKQTASPVVATGKEEDKGIDIEGVVTGTDFLCEIEDLISETTPVELGRKLFSNRLEEMLLSVDKLRASLASVFIFENLHGTRPTPADFLKLNEIYNRSATATGTELTTKRIERFKKAISYSEGRPKVNPKRLIGTAALERSEQHFKGISLVGINNRLSKAKQRVLTAHDVARIWCYFTTAYHWKDKQGEVGRVPWTAIKGLADKDHQFDGKRFKALSNNAITAAMKLFIQSKLIRCVEVAVHQYGSADNTCAKYEILSDPSL